MAPKKDKAPYTYLSNQMDYVNARDALKNYQSTYTSAKLTLENTPTSSKNYSEVVANFQAANTKIDSLQKAFNDAKDAATARYNEAKNKKTENKTAEKISDVQEQLTAAIKNRDQRYTAYNLPVPSSVQSQITKLQNQLGKINITGPTGPTGPTTAAGPTTATGPTTAAQESALIEDRTAFAQKYIGNVEKTKELQQALKDANLYKGKIDGIFRADEIDKSLDLADSKISIYETYGITFPNRLEALKRLATDFKTGGGPAGSGATTVISPRATATTYINAALKQVGIDRDATPEEIDNLTKVLNDAESRFKTTVKGGITKDLLGNRTQFIANLITTGKYVDPNTGKPIKGIKEDIQKAAGVLGTLSKSAQILKTDARSLTIQTLQSTAKANGVSLSPEQLEQYALEIQNGKDVKVIQSQIRNIAGLGRPDNIKKLLAEGTDFETIYAPYKRTMAAILELDPESIDINDSTLQTAIGDKELPIYEFKKVLKKDPRWQYTNNAREEVSNKALRVLRDFGFQG